MFFDHEICLTYTDILHNKGVVMPRRARTYLPGYPYHIVQRGNNRDVCFIEPENYQFYLELWRECAARYGVGIHAYCLMTNHVHFMVTPAVIKGDVANIN